MAVYETAALTLRCQDWSETSQVVQLLTRQVGRVRCLAKGSKRGQNAFGGPLDRWTRGEAVFSLRDPNQLAALIEVYETERFEGLRTRLPAFYGASCATELILKLVPDADPQPAVFDLTVETFRLLSEAETDACRAVTFAFAWRLLALLGYGPDLGRCVECARPIQGRGGVAFSPGLGGPLCRRCSGRGRTLRLSKQAAQALTFLAGADWSEVRRVRLSEATARQLRTALEARAEELGGTQLSAARYV